MHYIIWDCLYSIGKKTWKETNFITLGFTSSILLSVNPVQSQIAPDNTLPINSIVTPGCTVCTIEGGTQVGVNLFHSFREFSIPTGGEAFFNNTLQIQNILSRVTGNSVSNIDGLLRANGSANLFFINPNGIIFGSNARLNIGGSFLASTASSFNLPDGSEYSAINPTAPPLLTLNVTPGLQYPANSSATITNRGHLAAPQNLTLAAGNLDVQGQLQAGQDLTLQAQDTVQVRDSASTPFIATAWGKLLVQGNQQIDIFTLNHPDSGLFSGGDMVLRSANSVGGDAHYYAGGNFRIEQLDGNLGNLFSPNDPIIRSQGDVSFFGYFGTSLHILAGGQVTIDGDIVITGTDTTGDTINPTSTPQLANVTLSDGTPLVINGSTQPTVDIRAGVEPTAIGNPLGISGANFPADIFFNNFFFPVFLPPNNPTRTSADITIGGIAVDDGLVFITNQYQPNLQLPGGTITIAGSVNGLLPNGTGIVSGSVTGNGGPIIIDSRAGIALNGFLSASSLPFDSAPGNGGDITLLANGDITVAPDAFIDASGRLGGNIKINTFGNGSVSLAANVSSASNGTGVGKGGDVQVLNVRSLSLTNGAQLLSRTSGNATGGNLMINASEAVQLLGTSATGNASGLFAQTDGSGTGGNITITTPQLILRQGGQVAVNTIAGGQGGNLTIQDAQLVDVDGTNPAGTSASSLGTNALGSGNAGILNISTEQLIVRNGGQLGAGTFGSGDGGRIEITASDSVQVVGQGLNAPSGLFTSAQSGSSGNAGTLTIQTDRLLVQDQAQLSANTEGQGQGGNLAIAANQVIIQSGGQMEATTFSSGNAGTLTVNAAESIEVTGHSSKLATESSPEATGRAGSLTLTTGQLTLRDGGQISNSTFGAGQGGDISVTAFDRIEAIGTSADGNRASGILANAVGSEANAGDGGTLTLNTGQLIIRDGAQIGVGTFGGGDGGRLEVNASESVQVLGRGLNAGSSLFSAASPSSTGNAGNIQITTPQLAVQDGADISAATSGDGSAGDIHLQPFRDGQTLIVDVQNGKIVGSTDSSSPAGNLILTAPEAILIQGQGQLTVETSSTGTAGNVFITTPQLTLQNGAEVSASTSNAGSGGNIFINALNFVSLSDSELSSETNSSGNAGNVEITTGQLTLRNGAEITTSTEGTGRGGSIRVMASNAIEIVGAGSALFATTGVADGDIAPGQPSLVAQTGRAGDVTLTTGLLSIQDSAQVSVSSINNGGDAGNLDILARDVILSNQSRLAATTAAKSGGNITLRGLQNLLVNNSLVTASTQTGTAGDVTVNVSNSVMLQGGLANGVQGGIAVEATNGGNAGRLGITTNQFTLDNAQATVSSTSSGSAGNLEVQARDVMLSNQSQLAATTEAGVGGNITLKGLQNLLVNDSLVTASTQTGTAGNLTLDAAKSVELSGSFEGASAGLSVEATGDGTAGNLTVTTGQMSVRDRSQLTVSSRQGQAGNLNIMANSLVLNRGSLRAETAKSSPEGGANINLSGLDYLWMTNESLISASALNTANGGNITINAQFIIAPPATGTNGSDIIAKAVQGDGGRISINAQGIFGIEERPAIRGNRTNDIDASSQFGRAGEVLINTIVDPSRGLTQLPESLVDPTEQISQECAATGEETQNEFTVTGRGGLPQNPNEVISPDMVLDDFGTLTTGKQEKENSLSRYEVRSPISHPPNSIMEAQGWIINPDGQVILTAQAPNASPHRTWQPPVTCDVSHSGSEIADRRR